MSRPFIIILITSFYCSYITTYHFQLPPEAASNNKSTFFRKDSTVNLCDGSTFEYEDQFFNTDTSFCDTIILTDQTDSIICFNLQFDSLKESKLEVMLCEGSFFVFNGEELRTDTFICIQTQARNGCDSISCLNLSVFAPAEQTDSVFLCKGESYSYKGLSINRDATLCENLTATNGCDSTYCLVVRVLAPEINLQEQICEGDTLFWRGQILVDEGMYKAVAESKTDCDTSLSLELSFYEEHSLFIEPLDDICTDTTVRLTANNVTDYLWSTGARESVIQVSQAGIYTLTATDFNGCKTSGQIELNSFGIGEVQLNTINPTCFSYQDGRVQVVNIRGGMEPFLSSINGSAFQATLIYDKLEEGNYSLLIEDANGCRKSLSFELEAPEDLSIQLEDTISTVLGTTLELMPIFNFDPVLINWSSPNRLSCSDCTSPLVNTTEDASFRLVAIDANGCVVADTVNIIVDRETQIFTPNIFSPNGDGINDEWQIYSGPIIKQILRLQIVDKWGNLLVDRKAFRPESISWNGTFRGEAAAVGNYRFYLEAERVDGRIELFQGDIILIR